MDSPTSPEAAEPPGVSSSQAVNPPQTSKAGWKSWLIAGAVTAAVAVGGIVVLGNRDSGSEAASLAAAGEADANAPAAGAGFPGGAGRGTRGEVTKIEGSKLTVQATAPQGSTSTVVVETSAGTEVTEFVEGALSDLKTGDTVVVMGQEASGSITATSISAGEMRFGGGAGQRPPDGFQPPEGFRPPAGAPGGGARPQAPAGGQRPGGFTAGEITSISDAAITIKDQDGDTVTVTTTAETVVRVTKSLKVSDIEVGDTITATGETSNGILKASSIRIGDVGFGGRGGARFPGGRPGEQPGTTASD